MIWSNYVELAKKTANPDYRQSAADQLLQGVVGLDGELGELEEDASMDEWGDCFWYVALMDDALRRIKARTKTVSHVDSFEAVVEAKRQISNEIEKVVFQNRPLTEERVETLEKSVGRCREALRLECDHEFAEVLRYNINKLEERHGS